MNWKIGGKSFFDVVLIRSNPILHELRVSKIMNSISKKHSVLVLGWDREGAHTSFELLRKNMFVKRLKIKAPYARIQLLLYYPLFWAWVFSNLIIYRPKIIHACDLDAIVPGYVFKKLFSTKLIFDNFDRYAMAFVPPKHRTIYSLVNIIEEMLAYKSDALITVSEDRLSSFGKYRPDHSEVIMNCPDSKAFEDKPISNADEHRNLILVYAGGIARDRGLLLINQAIENLRDVHLLLAGRVFDDTMKHLLRNPNIRYVGLIRSDKVLDLESVADVMPILYDPSVPINRVASPNKLFDAMMLGVPVITNVCKEIVNYVGCGVVAEYDLNGIENAILRLKNNPLLRREMGAKGRLAFEKMYNWAMMEKKLLRLYSQLLKESAFP